MREQIWQRTHEDGRIEKAHAMMIQRQGYSYIEVSEDLIAQWMPEMGWELISDNKEESK